MKIADILPYQKLMKRITEATSDDTREMQKKYAYCKKQPHPFPFDGTPHSDTMVNTDGLRFLKPADYDLARYLWCTGMNDPADLAELADVLTKARRWERMQQRRGTTGDTSEVKEFQQYWKEAFDFAVTTCHEIGLDYFTGEHTSAEQWRKPRVTN